MFITASLTLNISAWFSKLLNISELECRWLILLKNPGPGRFFYLASPSVRSHWKHSPFTKQFWLLIDVTHLAKGSPHNASVVPLNSVYDASRTKCQCSLFCILFDCTIATFFTTVPSLNKIQEPITVGNVNASLPNVFNRAEVSLQHQPKALPGAEYYAGSCIHVIHFRKMADLKILKSEILGKRKKINFLDLAKNSTRGCSITCAWAHFWWFSTCLWCWSATGRYSSSP